MKRRSSARCTLCGAGLADAYLCADCVRELRELLVGDASQLRSQPGIVFYVKQLYKTAYRQSRMGGDVGTRASAQGYGLLADARATALLSRIRILLREWDERLYGLADRHHDGRALFVAVAAADYPEALAIRQARSLGAHVGMLARHDAEVARLHAQLLSLAREAWTVISRAPDVCCGACPHVSDPQHTKARCGVIMYAEDGATTVRCPKCRSIHDVAELREALREAAGNYVLPAAELMTLMETRLNDRIPKSSFYQLVRDGRLCAHSTNPEGTALYTYQDVVAARALPAPQRKRRAT